MSNIKRWSCRGEEILTIYIHYVVTACRSQTSSTNYAHSRPVGNVKSCLSSAESQMCAASGDLSFICMTVFRIMNFILSVSQAAELGLGPRGFAFTLLALSLQTKRRLIQTQPPPPPSSCSVRNAAHGTPSSFSVLYVSITFPLLSPSSFSGRHLRVLCPAPSAPTLAAVMSQRRLTLEAS